MDLPTDLTSSSSWLLNSRRSSGLTTTTDTSSRLTRASRRGGHRACSGSKPIVQNGLPHCVLPESPCPGRLTLIRSDARQQQSIPHFHAPTCEHLGDSGMGVLGRPLASSKAAVVFGARARTLRSALALWRPDRSELKA